MICLTPPQTIKATSQLGDPRVTYNLEDGMVPETNMPVRFYLSPNREDGSASILVSEPLDYETTSFFSLRVRAQNVAAVPLAAFTTVYVNITGLLCCVYSHLESSVCFEKTFCQNKVLLRFSALWFYVICSFIQYKIYIKANSHITCSVKLIFSVHMVEFNRWVCDWLCHLYTHFLYVISNDNRPQLFLFIKLLCLYKSMHS